jgi:predicted transcriptional regulator
MLQSEVDLTTSLTSRLTTLEENVITTVTLNPNTPGKEICEELGMSEQRFQSATDSLIQSDLLDMDEEGYIITELGAVRLLEMKCTMRCRMEEAEMRGHSVGDMRMSFKVLANAYEVAKKSV